MTLFKLSLKNIKKSMKDYAIYFFTLILGVAIFYVFNSIDSQTAMIQMTGSRKQILKLMTTSLSAVSVFVSFVLGFLIIYASRFLMKRRKKEFGVYMTLGMSKRKISTILFIETLMIGIISLVVGLVLGVVASQGMSVIVVNMFEADMTNFTFSFSGDACLKTLLYFGIMYLFVMIFNVISVSRTKLIDLLQAGRKTEEVKLKNPILCIVIFVIAAAMLARAYYMVTGGVENFVSESYILRPIGLGIVGTFLVFWSLSGLMIRIVMSMKNFYYRKLNSFTMRQVSSKINTTVFSMTVICLMLFITICILSSALSLKNGMNSEITKGYPRDISLQKGERASELSIDEVYKSMGVDTSKYLKDRIDYEIYEDDAFTLKEFMGDNYEQMIAEYPYMSYDTSDTPESIISVSDYNKLADLFKNKKVTLEKNQYAVVADYQNMMEIRTNYALKTKNVIVVFGQELTPVSDKCLKGSIYMSSSNSNAGVIVVPDEIVKHQRAVQTNLIANYIADSDEEKKVIDSKFRIDEEDENYEVLLENGIFVDTKIGIKQNAVGLGAIVTFIAIYMGIIFLISSAAILALKELSESSDNVERYRALRRIGADEKDLNKALFAQTGIFFLTPLLLAIVHSVFGMKFAMKILENLGRVGLWESVIMTAVFLVIIYGGYFIITYLCSKRIIRE